MRDIRHNGITTISDADPAQSPDPTQIIEGVNIYHPLEVLLQKSFVIIL